MEVTEIRVFLADEERLKAYVTVTFDSCFVVRDLKVIAGNSGLFVAMPSKKRKDGVYRDIAHPISSEFRDYLEKQVLQKYEDERKLVDAGFKAKVSYDDDLSHSGDQTHAAPSYDQSRSHELGVAPVKNK